MSGLQGTTGPGRTVSLASAGALVVQTPMFSLVTRYLQWIQFVRERSENTIASYAFDLRRFVEFCEKSGIDRPDKIRLQFVEAYLAWLRYEKRLSVPTANRHRACLKSFFAYLLREEIIEKGVFGDSCG